MGDKRLTLLGIEDDTPHAESALSSAYQTAVGDEETPDKVIHLAVSLRFCSCERVIGTL
ncbi:uncharacterized protein F5891DRAFT_1013540 [Suillus fuscotomentosus]|uniref:Uncharacterized protein n=1 Tax=Suillus fuscotomentosus TaxID=1912939 RepID=A0AAD4EDF3_9AGAM|nr:uncharacterized protein F5891DRAFT_1013540 [Suillus fuscotomentosus]KAG1904240.1 hypothetical protein F5891DRAFT_1013540 [Suillus fuscotomentosus]